MGQGRFRRVRQISEHTERSGRTYRQQPRVRAANEADAIGAQLQPPPRLRLRWW